jgi:hypothetical protein
MDKMLKENLKYIQPTKEALDLFLLILEVNYEKRIRSLEARRRIAEKQETELKLELISLVRNENKGKYPKEIFNEVKVKIEEELMAAKIVKNENLISKYDLEATSDFIRELLSDLSKAYDVSDYGQRQVLVGSIYPSGIAFKDGQLLNHNISPIYCDIRDTMRAGVPLRVDNDSYLEPHFDLFLQLKEAYPNFKTQFNYA